MSQSQAMPPRLSDEQVGELLSLVDDADSVELKLTVPESDQRSAVQTLDMDPLDAEIRQVSSSTRPISPSTTRALWLAPAGCREGRRLGGEAAAGRARRAPADLRQSPDLVVEVDAMPGGSCAPPR
jgi:hypothetical protein